jgi:hypothetical protein
MPLASFPTFVAAACLSLGTLAQPTTHPAPVPAPQIRAWPVHIVDGDSHPACNPPLAVVGSLFTGGHSYREDDAGTIHRTPEGQIVQPVRLVANKYSKAMGEYLLGNIRPRPSCNDEETCVFLASPPLNPYNEFRVDKIEQEGSTFMVHVSYWRDDSRIQWGPGPYHTAQMVRLGWLPPGDYTLVLRVNDRFSRVKGTYPGLYSDEGVRMGQTKFTVAKADAWSFHTWDQPASTAVIHEKNLTVAVPPYDSAGKPQPMLQKPYFAFRRSPAPAAKAEASTTIALAPEVDWHKDSQLSESLWTIAKGEPKPEQRSSMTVVARISGGTPRLLGRYDWAEINKVEWTGANVVIHASVWRKPYIHGNNALLQVPEFAVPLETGQIDADPLKAASAIKVSVVWHEGIDNPRNALEEVRH